MQGGDELINALKAAPGCLGVEVAFTQTRKAVIFSWFESKKAVLDWYESDYHQGVMMEMREAAMAAEKDGTAPGYESGEGAEEYREPLAHVKDDVGPVLCIATITPALKQTIPGFPQPISQISIELYTPLPGGIAVNGKFAPAALKVPHLMEFDLGAPAPATEKPAEAKQLPAGQ